MQQCTNETWFGAISDNAIEKVTTFLDEGMNVNITDDNGWTALHIAVYKDFTDLVALLINRGADIQQKMQNRSTALKIALNNKHIESTKLLLSAGAHFDPMALHYAAEHGCQEIVQLLLDAGADVHVKNKDGYTPLECALRNGHMHIVALFIAYGADACAKNNYDLFNAVINNDITQLKTVLLQVVDPNIKNEFCPGTVLHIAVYYGYQEIVQLLIAHGAKMNADDHDDWREWRVRRKISVRAALEQAIDCGQIEIVKLLLAAGRNVQIPTKELGNALGRACRKNQIDIVKLFVKYGVNVNVQDSRGETALHQAAENGHFEIVRMLLEAGANVHILNKLNSNPLDVAFLRGHIKIVELLIAHGASSSLKNVAELLQTKKNNTSWFEAIRNNDIAQVKRWLAQGFDANSEEEHGTDIALHHASRLGFFELAKLLIAYKANVNIKDYYGNPPLHYAVENNFANIVTLLIKNGAEIDAKNEEYEGSDARPWTALQLATHEGHTEVVALLLANGANIFVIDEEYDSDTLLHIAAAYGYEEIVELLIKNCMDINAPARYDQTPLHYAVANHRTNIVEFLINCGAKIDAKAAETWTALHTVSKYGPLEIAQILLAHGADVHAKIASGLTPLHLACFNGQKEIVALLLEKGALPNARDNDGKTPHMIALEKGHHDIVLLLEEYEKNKFK